MNEHEKSHDIIILRIRSLIADKEMITAQANLDLARCGEWRCDWTIGHAQIDAEIEELHSLANVIGQARREEAKFDQTPSSASPAPTCSDSY